MRRRFAFRGPMAEKAGRAMSRLFTFAALLCVVSLAACETVPYVEPPAYEPELHCQTEFMGLDESQPDSGWMRISDGRKMEQAFRECGAYTQDILIKTQAVARHNRPDTLKARAVVFGAGAGSMAALVLILKIAGLLAL